MKDLMSGRITIPSENDFYDETMAIAAKWGADAVRDSDGTRLDSRFKESHMKIYNAYFPVRGHNDFIEEHPEACPEAYLLSQRVVAAGEKLEIPFMATYFDQQLKPDYRHDPHIFWEVRDRTTGKVTKEWQVDQQTNTVSVLNPIAWHEYTVAFLAYVIWDPVEMYNHLTNDWGDKPHEMPFDIVQPQSQQFIKATLKKWLVDHPEVDVVRFTTFFYQFTLIFNQHAKEKYVDWFGYDMTVSPRMMTKFEAATDIHLTAEDFVDEGYYNSPFRVPTENFRAYIDYVAQFVSEQAKDLVDIVHDAGREAMMFLGDHWIGTEPYGKYFNKIGLDAVVGSIGDGTTTRMITDISGVGYKEGRFLPYFFPDSFNDKGTPSKEAIENWIQARRAILRAGLARMGYGGYLSLAAKYPEFINTVSNITDEFRDIHAQTQNQLPVANLKVYILNHWGKLRSWQAFTVAHALYSKGAYSYYGVLEALSGMNVDVHFIDFSTIEAEGVPSDADVLMNIGDVDTAYSGGQVWQNSQLVAAINAYVYQGGGFIGVGDPSATEYQGRFFQLGTLLGVEREVGNTLSLDKYFTQVTYPHFITADQNTFNFGESKSGVYALDETTEILEYSNQEIHLSAHDFGSGRGVYLAGLPFTFDNARLLQRSLYYAAHQESLMLRGFSTNQYCEVNIYPELNKYCVINNSAVTQTTRVHLDEERTVAHQLAGYAIEWRKLK